MKTVRVRIAVVVDEDGFWFAYGDSRGSDEEAMGEACGQTLEPAKYFVEAELPLPETKVVPADSVTPSPTKN